MKRLIVCCDGTWNTPEMICPTNVVKIAQAIPDVGNDQIPQIVFYDEGIGTQNVLDKFAGGALGKGIDLNVQQAYRFLALNYKTGDEIYLFGFSRGAYTVRSLAGMIGHAGLLDRYQITEVKEAYELYRNNQSSETAECKSFRKINKSLVSDITFMGCWDTVEALGLPNKIDFIKIDEAFKNRYRFINPKLGKHIKRAAHAVAINETREEFNVTLMKKHSTATARQVTEEWFPGDHGSVGGGTNHKRPLSDVTLKWIMQQTEKSTDLRFDMELAPYSLLEDHTVYFDEEASFIYSQKFRTIPKNAIFHMSAINRYIDIPNYEHALPENVNELIQKVSVGLRPKLKLLKRETEIKVGAKVHALIFSKNHENKTNIKFVKNGTYRLSVANTQFWKDGDLIPCSANGWNLNDNMEMKFKNIARSIIKIGEKFRLKVIDAAEWFELIGRVKGTRKNIDFRIGDGRRLKNSLYVAKKAGTFYAFANDAKTFLVDKYGDNKGWVVLEVERVS